MFFSSLVTVGHRISNTMCVLFATVFSGIGGGVVFTGSTKLKGGITHKYNILTICLHSGPVGLWFPFIKFQIFSPLTFWVTNILANIVTTITKHIPHSKHVQLHIKVQGYMLKTVWPSTVLLPQFFCLLTEEFNFENCAVSRQYWGHCASSARGSFELRNQQLWILHRGESLGLPTERNDQDSKGDCFQSTAGR